MVVATTRLFCYDTTVVVGKSRISRRNPSAMVRGSVKNTKTNNNDSGYGSREKKSWSTTRPENRTPIATTASTTSKTLEKTDGAPVTALDFAIQGYILSSLQLQERKASEIKMTHVVSPLWEKKMRWTFAAVTMVECCCDCLWILHVA